MSAAAFGSSGSARTPGVELDVQGLGFRAIGFGAGRLGFGF